jgi:hypothetical protein
VGPETSSRTFDKIDFILLPIVLLLQVSPLVLGLISFSMKLFLRVYNYLFAQCLVAGIHDKVLPTLQLLLYFSIHLAVFMMVRLQALFQFTLLFPLLLWQGICFWPIFYYQLFCLGARGCSFWEIILDPDNKESTQRKTKNQQSVGTIRPL